MPAQDCLAGRKTVGRITGDICVGGFRKVQKDFVRVSGEGCTAQLVRHRLTEMLQTS